MLHYTSPSSATEPRFTVKLDPAMIAIKTNCELKKNAALKCMWVAFGGTAHFCRLELSGSFHHRQTNLSILRKPNAAEQR